MAKIKEFLFVNIYWKFASLLLAIFIWLICMNSINPVTVKSVTVPLTILNEQMLEDNNLMLTSNLENQSIRVNLRGKSSDLDKIKQNNDPNIVASIDMKYIENLHPVDINNVQPTQVKVQLKGDLDKEELKRNMTYEPQEIVFTLDISETIKKVVNPTQVSPAENYRALPSTTIPEEVSISGARSVLNSIASINVEISNGYDNTKDIIQTGTPKAYDKDGNLVKDVKISPEEVEITIPIRKEGKVYIREPQYIGEPAEGYVFRGFEVSPPFIKVYGTEAALKATRDIGIENPIDITGKSESEEFIYDVRPMIKDSNLTIDFETSHDVVFKAIIEKLETRIFEIPVGKINIKGYTQNHTIDYDSDHFTITLKGAKSLIDALSEDEITSSLSVLGLDIGSHIVPINVILPKDIAIDGDKMPEIGVTINEVGTMDNNTDNTTENTTENNEE